LKGERCPGQLQDGELKGIPSREKTQLNCDVDSRPPLKMP
jgi:hypothetical protein